jgi:hypothetical protein
MSTLAAFARTATMSQELVSDGSASATIACDRGASWIRNWGRTNNTWPKIRTTLLELKN